MPAAKRLHMVALRTLLSLGRVFRHGVHTCRIRQSSSSAELLVQDRLRRICVEWPDFFEARMKRLVSRRMIIVRGLAAGASIPLFGLTAREAWAAALTPLDPADPTAKSLNFLTDSSKVNATANPTFKPTQKCASCAQYQGKPGDSSGGCIIFAGHSVPANGWCKVWAQKPGA